MGGVVLPSTTPTGGTNFKIDISVLTKREERKSAKGVGGVITGSCLRVDIHNMYACANIVVYLSCRSINQVHECVLVV